MARRERTVFRDGKGNNIRVTVEKNREWLWRFSDTNRRRLFIDAVMFATTQWRNTYLARRIQKETVQGNPFYYKGGGNTPMIGPRRRSDPSKLINAIYRGKITPKVPTPKKQTDPPSIGVDIAIPFGHPVKPAIVKAFRILPQDEVQAWGDWFAQRIAQSQEGAIVQTRGKHKGRMKLSPEQREKLMAPARRRR